MTAWATSAPPTVAYLRRDATAGPGIDTVTAWATALGLRVVEGNAAPQGDLDVPSLGTILWVDADDPMPSRTPPSSTTPTITVHPAPIAPSELEMPGEVIHGRGAEGVRWAMASLRHRSLWPPTRVEYGPERDQHASLRVPRGPGPHPVAVLYHGGFWREHWTADLMDALAIDLAGRGHAAWNVEYRRIPSHSGAPEHALGGWRATVADAVAALDRLASLGTDHPIDLTNVTVLGHSAGAQLGFMAASKATRVRPRRIVSLAGVLDLAAVLDEGDADNGVRRFLGRESGDALHQVSPIDNVPLGIDLTVVHGLADDVVPASVSRDFAERARAAGDRVITWWPEDVDHMPLIDPGSDVWQRIGGAITGGDWWS